jgi:hypothetical protein
MVSYCAYIPSTQHGRLDKCNQEDRTVSKLVQSLKEIAANKKAPCGAFSNRTFKVLILLE